MRDSRIGTFGALALGLVLALKVDGARGDAGRRSPPPRSSPATPRAGSRASSSSPPAATSRADRHRRLHRRRPRPPAAWPSPPRPAASASPACRRSPAPAPRSPRRPGSPPATCSRARLFERRLGGYTGDCLGATQQLSEVGALPRDRSRGSDPGAPHPARGRGGVCYGRDRHRASPPSFAAEADGARRAARRPVDRIVTSPLARCRRLADHLGARLGAAGRRSTPTGARWTSAPGRAGPGTRSRAPSSTPGPPTSWTPARTAARASRCSSPAPAGALARCRAGRGLLAVTHAGPIRAALFADRRRCGRLAARGRLRRDNRPRPGPMPAAHPLTFRSPRTPRACLVHALCIMRASNKTPLTIANEATSPSAPLRTCC